MYIAHCTVYKVHLTTVQTMSMDSSESASASESAYDDLEYLNLIFQVGSEVKYIRYIYCTLCSVQHAVYSVHCTVCSVQCGVNSVECAVYSVQFAVYSAVGSVQYAVYKV